MKKIYIVLVLIFTVCSFNSCETYDEYNADRPTIIRFTLGGVLPLTINAANPTRSFDIPYFVSDATNSDRTFEIVVVADMTEVASENFTFPSSIVLPAGENRGTVRFTAMDVSLTNEALPVTLTFVQSGELLIGPTAELTIRSTL
jgi:hypothetical protein